MKTENNRISELIVRVQGGDKAAFEELYKLTGPKAYFVALKICKNEHDAEDILQESYIKALEKIDTVDPEGNFTAWLYQIVANRSKNFIKAKKPVLFSEDEEEIIGSLPDEDLSFSPEENVDREELRNEVMAAVDELTEEKRACVMMMYFGDMSVNEIAQSLEVPVSTVKNRLFTARKDLKNKFEKKGITALYSAAPLGVVIWALGKSGEATAAAFAASASSAAVLTGIGASSAAASTVTTATAAATATSTAAVTSAATGTGIAAKIATLSVAQKVVAGVAAAGIIGGSTAGVATVAKKIVSSNETTTYIEEVTTAPSQTEEFAFAVIPTEESTTGTTTAVSEPTATTSKPADKETTTKQTQSGTSEKTTSTSKTTSKAATTTNRTTTTQKPTTTQKQTTTQKATTTKNNTTTTKPTTTEEETTTRPTTTRPTTTQPTTTQPTTTEPTTQAPATVTVEVMDMNEDLVDTLTLSVPAGTEMTWEYLVALIKSEGHEPKAGIYGDAVGAVAEAGKTYSVTAEL